jgi:peptide/nickel transport system substrate-binding protein
MTSATPAVRPFRPGRRAAGTAAGGLAVALALAACSGGSGASDAAAVPRADNPANVLKVGVVDSISNLLPGVEAGEVNYWVAAIQAEGLVTLGSDGSLQPALATSWTQPNPTTYVYELDADAKFQNGAPVTTADVLASIDAARDPKVSPAESYLWGGVESVKQTGPAEITITLSAPSASFKYTPSSSAGLWVYPASYWKSAGQNVGTAAALPVGTGPFQFTGFNPSSGIKLTKSKYWRGTPAKFDEVQIQAIPDANTEKLALENGDIDLAIPIPVSQYASWAKNKKIETFFTPNRSLMTIDFDTSVKPFDDQHVRNAIAYAFDRKAFVSKVLSGRGQVATSLLTPEQFSGVKSVKEATGILAGLQQYDFDLDKAKQELSKSSTPTGLTFDVQVPSAYPELKTAAQLLQQNLDTIGVKVTITTGTTEDWYGTMADGKHGVGFMSYSTVSADPGELSNWFLVSDTKPGDASNPANLQNTDIDAAIGKARAATDNASYLDAILQANTIQNENNYYAPLTWGQLAIASNDVKLDGFTSYTLTTPWVLHVSPK